MFNLIDIIVLAIILISAFVGYKRGFVKTAVGLVAFFVAIGLSLMFYKPLAVILTEKTSIDDWIVENLEHPKKVESGETMQIVEEKDSSEMGEEEATLQSVFEKLPDAIIEKIDIENAKQKATHEVALKVSELIMNLLSLIIIFVVVKFTLFIAELLLSGLMELPVLKQVNEILGMCVGAAIGFIEIYISFAIITFISSITNISFVVDAIKVSAFASSMFENNLIIKLLF